MWQCVINADVLAAIVRLTIKKSGNSEWCCGGSNGELVAIENWESLPAVG